jgi:hypothetical protein
VRALFIDPADDRPISALEGEALNAERALAGLAASLGIHVTLPVAIAVMVAVFAAVAPGSAADDSGPAIEEDNVIAARFVQLGREFDPDELPDRQVPLLSTAPPQPRPAPSKNMNPEPRTPPDAGTPPPDSVEDPIARLGDRAQAFAEIAERREREGNPEGIEEGTETEAGEGDLWLGRLRGHFRRGWSVPTTLDPETVRGLRARFDVVIGRDLRIARFSMRGEGSGNPLFDQSINEHLTRMQASGDAVPPPPNDEVADAYLGQAIGLSYNGRDAR